MTSEHCRFEQQIYSNLLQSSESSEFVRKAWYTSQPVFTGDKVTCGDMQYLRSFDLNLFQNGLPCNFILRNIILGNCDGIFIIKPCMNCMKCQTTLLWSGITWEVYFLSIKIAKSYFKVHLSSKGDCTWLLYLPECDGMIQEMESHGSHWVNTNIYLPSVHTFDWFVQEEPIMNVIDV